MNLSSIVVQVKPEYLEELISTIKESSFCEYHLHDEKGRIIVTVEGEGIEEEIKKLKKIKTLPNVISAEVVYSYSEDEIDREMKKLENSDNLPEWLNDNNIKAEDIKYGGDLKKRF